MGVMNLSQAFNTQPVVLVGGRHLDASAWWGGGPAIRESGRPANNGGAWPKLGGWA